MDCWYVRIAHHLWLCTMTTWEAYLQHSITRRCGLTQYYGYHTKGSAEGPGVFFDEDCHSLPYFVSSRETAFSIKLLKRFDAQILLGQQSFKQCAEVYNHLHFSLDTGTSSHLLTRLRERQLLDRRRVEDAYYQYAVVKVCHWYPDTFCLANLPLHAEISETLPMMTKVYHGLFMKCYSSHKCEQPGCGWALVFDGNLKNHRDVCFAANAGYAEFKGLNGQVRIGCQDTPSFKSRYCELHKPKVPATAKTPAEDSDDAGDHQLGIITGKRVTRTSVLYEVVWLGDPNTSSAWEPASNLPSVLVEDFERGISYDISHNSFSSAGETFHTITAKAVDGAVQTPSKRSKVEIDTSSSGVFVDQPEDHATSCNTVKDRTRLNHKTAGILMGAWPCGKIVMLGELFGSESMSQVYGQVHTLLQETPQQFRNLRFLIYDDACHLKKYACNPVRKDVTATSKIISEMNIVVDKLHFRGHVDSWCHSNCNPYTFGDLKMVDTEICEQLFSWMSRYARITQHMNRLHFMFYLLFLCDSRNRMS